MWLEENRSNILSDNPDFSDEADIIKEGMIRFRVLSTEERKVRGLLYIKEYPKNRYVSYKSKGKESFVSL